MAVYGGARAAKQSRGGCGSAAQATHKAAKAQQHARRVHRGAHGSRTTNPPNPHPPGLIGKERGVDRRDAPRRPPPPTHTHIHTRARQREKMEVACPPPPTPIHTHPSLQLPPRGPAHPPCTAACPHVQHAFASSTPGFRRHPFKLTCGGLSDSAVAVHPPHRRPRRGRRRYSAWRMAAARHGWQRQKRRGRHLVFTPRTPYRRKTPSREGARHVCAWLLTAPRKAIKALHTFPSVTPLAPAHLLAPPAPGSSRTAAPGRRHAFPPHAPALGQLPCGSRPAGKLQRKARASRRCWR